MAAKLKAFISPEERIRREKIIGFARGSVRYEGIVLTPEIEGLNDLYINGEIDKTEHTRRCLAVIDSY
ncbi:antitoxin VbhA family protein [Pandoraea communis]|uniref:antitoxin VbhA family protein n=1 Tax=Pandoraea communis TaxID=2508297 RepID=UPI0025A5D501|nr:antitoxin VbhA family protein [Pandoraea communis]MDM8356168.1 antitoxin VbhA family protein [Pandoraea communis]